MQPAIALGSSTLLYRLRKTVAVRRLHILLIAPGKTAGATVVAMFRAEGSKILVIIGQLWLVLATYREVVLPALLASFVVTVLLFRVALFVRDR